MGEEVRTTRRRPHRPVPRASRAAGPVAPPRPPRPSASRAGWSACPTRSTGSAPPGGSQGGRARQPRSTSWPAASTTSRSTTRAPYGIANPRRRRSPRGTTCRASASSDAHTRHGAGRRLHRRARCGPDGRRGPARAPAVTAPLVTGRGSLPRACLDARGQGRPAAARQSPRRGRAWRSAPPDEARAPDDRRPRLPTRTLGRPTPRSRTSPPRAQPSTARARPETSRSSTTRSSTRSRRRRRRCRSGCAIPRTIISIVLPIVLVVLIAVDGSARHQLRRSWSTYISQANPWLLLAAFGVYYLGLPAARLSLDAAAARRGHEHPRARLDRDHLHQLAGQLPRAGQAGRRLPRLPAARSTTPCR